MNSIANNVPSLNRGTGIWFPLSSFMSQFAFALSIISLFVYLFLNKNVKITELFWHLLFMGTFIWNTECLTTSRECTVMGGLSMVYPVIYLVTFTYFNVQQAAQNETSEKRGGVLEPIT